MNARSGEFSQTEHTPVSGTQIGHRAFLAPPEIHPPHLRALPGGSRSPRVNTDQDSIHIN